jgi:hypothetical protein
MSKIKYENCPLCKREDAPIRYKRKAKGKTSARNKSKYFDDYVRCLSCSGYIKRPKLKEKGKTKSVSFRKKAKK